MLGTADARERELGLFTLLSGVRGSASCWVPLTPSQQSNRSTACFLRLVTGKLAMCSTPQIPPCRLVMGGDGGGKERVKDLLPTWICWNLRKERGCDIFLLVFGWSNFFCWTILSLVLCRRGNWLFLEIYFAYWQFWVEVASAVPTQPSRMSWRQ